MFTVTMITTNKAIIIYIVENFKRFVERLMENVINIFNLYNLF